MKEIPAGWADRDTLFTVTVALMWRLYDAAAEQGREVIAMDLILAVGELNRGPWRVVDGCPPLEPVPFTRGCVMVDRLLEELARVTPGFGARIAITKARYWLDPEHAQVDP